MSWLYLSFMILLTLINRHSLVLNRYSLKSYEIHHISPLVFGLTILILFVLNTSFSPGVSRKVINRYPSKQQMPFHVANHIISSLFWFISDMVLAARPSRILNVRTSHTGCAMQTEAKLHSSKINTVFIFIN